MKAAVAAALALWASMDRPKIDAAVAAAATEPLPARIEKMSMGFLNAPYVVSPLGEGKGHPPDEDPMIRFDQVDCLTFVETTLAMSLAARPDEVEPLLQKIRYESEPSYANRNHLMEVQWIPNNIKKGFLVDVTRKYGGDDVIAIKKTITAKTWAAKEAKDLALPKARQVVGDYPIEIVPAEKALAHAKALPNGTVIVVVRDDRPLLVTRVSHVGFLFQKNGKPTLRHASRTWGKTADEDFEAFISRNLHYAKWAVTGFAFFEVRKPE